MKVFQLVAWLAGLSLIWACQPVAIEPEARQKAYFATVRGGGFCFCLTDITLMDHSGTWRDLEIDSDSSIHLFDFDLTGVSLDSLLGLPYQTLGQVDAATLAEWAALIPEEEAVTYEKGEDVHCLVPSEVTTYYALRYDLAQQAYQWLLIGSIEHCGNGGWRPTTREGKRLWRKWTGRRIR